ncbi:MAG: hypothetical protein HPY55_16115 [Firmicutes bacterium]|nr:hypothetical protein [Bacillota bacterium]
MYQPEFNIVILQSGQEKPTGWPCSRKAAEHISKELTRGAVVITFSDPDTGETVYINRGNAILVKVEPLRR